MTPLVRLGRARSKRSVGSPLIPFSSREPTPLIKDPLILVATGSSTVNALSSSMRSPVEATDLLTALRELKAQICGLEPQLGDLFEDPTVTDILFNGPHEIWLDRGEGLVHCPLSVENDVRLRALAIRLSALAGKRLDDAQPIVDGTLPGGIRLHAVLPPLAHPHPNISLRCPSMEAISFEHMLHTGALNSQVAEILRRAVLKRKNAFISGATGSGKTTLLSALLELVCPNQRIICIEEVSELRPRHPHVLHLQERKQNIQGHGGVDMSELVKAAMRMRPDRIVLGECRGSEVREVLSAMNTGHSGSFATVHANSALDVPARLISLGTLAGLKPEAVQEQILSAVDLFIHVSRTFEPPTHRYVSQIALCASRVSELPADGASRALKASSDSPPIPTPRSARLVIPALDIDPNGTSHPRAAYSSLLRMIEED